MNAVAGNFQKAAFLYAAPRLDAGKFPLPLDRFRKCDSCPDRLAYTVEGREGDWIHVKTHEGQEGYLLAHPQNGISLNQRMPEVSFLQGAMGFLRYAVQASIHNHPEWASGISVADNALREYARREEAAQEPETKAAALQLSGILEFALTPNAPSPQVDTAFQLVPYSSDSRNLAAVFRLYEEYNSPSRLRPRDLANDFVAAVSLDPRNPLALANLQTLYELLASPEIVLRVAPEFAIKSDELQASIDKVKAIRNDLRENRGPGR
jgi:hypothetical protein